MNDLIEKLRAAVDVDEAAIDAYVAHRAGGEHVNFAGQDPAGYDEHDSCSRCIETGKASRYRDPGDGRRMVAAHREILELHQPRTHEARAFVEEGRRKDPAVLYEPTGTVQYTACPTCGGRDWDIERFDTWEPCPTLIALAKGYGIEVE